MKCFLLNTLGSGALLIALTCCAQAPNANCYSVCDERVATDCADIEQETCYNLCDAFAQTSTECAEATEALSLCQLEQAWICSDIGPSLQAPIACETEENIQIVFCIDPPTGEERALD